MFGSSREKAAAGPNLIMRQGRSEVDTETDFHQFTWKLRERKFLLPCSLPWGHLWMTQVITSSMTTASESDPQAATLTLSDPHYR